MNDTTELPSTPDTPDGTSIFAETEVLDDSPIPPETVSSEADATRPRVRIGAVVWGLIVTIVAAVTIVTTLDPVSSAEFADWAGNVSGESIGLIALIAIGGLILLLGLVSLLRQAQRRGERA